MIENAFLRIVGFNNRKYIPIIKSFRQEIFFYIIYVDDIIIKAKKKTNSKKCISIYFFYNRQKAITEIING